MNTSYDTALSEDERKELDEKVRRDGDERVAAVLCLAPVTVLRAIRGVRQRATTIQVLRTGLKNL